MTINFSEAVGIMQQEILDLTDEVLSVPLEGVVPNLETEWNRIVLLHLLRAHQSLGAIRITAAEGWYAPSVVLTRYLFELAINLSYLGKDLEKRVPAYLERSRAVPDLKDVDEVTAHLDTLWEQGSHTGITKSLLPGSAWKPLKEMCEDLGLMEHYDTMYRHASEVAHGGAHGMANELLEHLGMERRPDWEIPGVLTTALIYYGSVVEVACRTIPELTESFQFGTTWKERINRIQEAIRGQIRLEH